MSMMSLVPTTWTYKDTRDRGAGLAPDAAQKPNSRQIEA